MSVDDGGVRFVGSAAITAVLQILSMAVGALLALVILREFGKSAQTDGLLAAYGLYGLVLVVAGTLRTTTVGPMTRGGDLFGGLDTFVGGALLIIAVTAAPFVILAGPTADALTGDLPQAAHDAAASSLVLFWAASAAQLVTAVCTAALAVRREFALAGAAYVLGTSVALVVVLAVGDSMGTDAAAAGVLGGSVLGAALVAGRLVQAGWRPAPRRMLPSAQTGGALRTIVFGAMGVAGWQATYVVTLGFAANLGAGAVTLYTYAFFAVGIIIGATGAPASIVMAAPVADVWDGDERRLRPMIVDVLRAGLTIVVPVIAAAALIGDDVIVLLLGSELTRADAQTIVACVLILGPVIAMHLGGTVSTLAAFAAGWHRRLAVIAVLGVLVHAALCALALGAGELEWLVAVHLLSMGAILAANMTMVHRRGAATTLGVLAAETARYAALGLVAYGPPGIAAWAVGGVLAELTALLVGTAVCAGLLRLQPAHWGVARRMAAPILGLAGSR